MKRTAISPNLIIIFLALPFILLFATGQLHIPGNLLGIPTASFDSASNIVFSYTDSNGVHTSTQTLGSTVSSGNLPVASLGYAGAASIGTPCALYVLCTPAVSWASAALGTSSMPPPTNAPTSSGSGSSTASSSCGSSSACLRGSITGGISSTYQLGLSIQNAKLVGTGDFSGEPTPSAGNGWRCVTGNVCNPVVANYTFTNSTSTYNSQILVYRYALLVQLQLSGDHVNAITKCWGVDGSQCTILEVGSLNSLLNSINQVDYAKGTVYVDVNGQLIVSTPADKYTILNAWIGQAGTGSSGGGNAGCITSLPNGGTASLNPCIAHSEVTNTVQPFSYSQPVNVNSYSPQQLYQLFTSGWNPNGQFILNYNLQPQYKAVCGTINCLASSTQDCLTAGTGNANPVQLPGGGTAGNACLIQADYGITVQVPIVFDIASVTTKPLVQAQNNVQSNTIMANQTSAFASLSVHVQDSILPLPLAGMNVGLVSSSGGGGCSSVQSSKQTDNNGNVLFSYLTPGAYQLCASGGSGALSLIIFSVGLVYSPAQTSVSLNPGGNNAVLVLQGNLVSVLTTFSLVLLGIGIVVFVIILIMAPSSLVKLGLGGVQGYKSLRGRRR